MQTYGLLVIGSGPAGVSAAQGYVESGGPGPVLLVSSDPEETYDRPPLSKELLAGDRALEPTPMTEAVVPDAVEVRLGSSVTGLDLDAHTATVGDEAIGFERLVVATGSHPRPFPGGQDAGAGPQPDVHLLRSFTDARALVEAAGHARTAVVIGSGFIGCEAAASLAKRGVATTLVTPERAPQVDRLGAFAAARITEWLTALGVQLRTGVQVTGIDAPRTIHLDDGMTLSPDLVLAAVGVTPAGDLLESPGAIGHVQVHEGRIVADEHLQAGERVWVAGDVARAMHGITGRPIVVEHWGDALAMGRLAGANAAADAAANPAAGVRGSNGSAQQPWQDVPGFWSTIGEHTLMYSAWGDGFERVEVVERPGAFTVWYADPDDTLVGVLAYNAEDDYERGGELIAAGATVTQAMSGDSAPSSEDDEAAPEDS